MSAEQRAASVLREADALLISAGAGMGVDSGLPDFRGPQGFWRAYPALAKLGLRFEEIANPTWFERNPGLAWAFYGHRLNLYRRTTPHAGFGLLLELARTKPHGAFVFTSNVDGHFRKSGFDADRIVECHGSIHHLQCARPCSQEIWDAPDAEIQINEQDFEALPPLPACPRCGGMARPNILMFGDPEWHEHRSVSQENRMETWLNALPANARLAVIEMGAGTAIPTVRFTSERVAQQKRGTLIRLNPREPKVPRGHIGLSLGACEAIRRLVGR